MKILYLSQYYPPEMGAPAARVSAFARRWAAMGHEVTVLTTFPNHPTGIIPEEYRGLVRLIEDDAGVRVVRTFLYAAANRGVVKRSASYASFAASAVVLGYGVVGRPDLVIGTSPQFLAAVAGWVLSRLKGVPFVAEIRDLWPDSIVAVGALAGDSLVVRGLARMERFLYGHSDLVVSVTRSFVPLLRERGARSVVVVPNGADPARFEVPGARAASRARYGLGERFVASFVGTIGMAHGLETVLEAASSLRDDPGVLFWLVGDGARREQLLSEARRRGLDNVRFEGQLPRDEMPHVLAASDAALVLLRPDPLFETVLPSKMFEAMASGCPVILGVGGEARRVLEQSGAGIAITPGDPEALLAAIVRLRGTADGRERMGSNGRRFVAERYSHDALARDYLAALAPLVGGEPAGPSSP